MDGMVSYLPRTSKRLVQRTLKVVLIISFSIGLYIVISININHRIAESFCKSLDIGQEYKHVINEIEPTIFSKHDVLIIPMDRSAETWSGMIQIRWREPLSRFDCFCNIVVQDGKVATSYLSSRDNS
jgi:hypothetical protein